MDSSMILKQLNERRNLFLETRKMKDLNSSIAYNIKQIRTVNTQYGPSVIATLEFKNDKFSVFLPKRFNENFSEEIIKHMNNNAYIMRYLGGKYHDIKFEAALSDKPSTRVKEAAHLDRF